MRYSTILFLAGALPAQNLVTNGDFQGGNTTGWTFSGFAQVPRVLSFNTTGTDTNNSFSCRPGSRPGTNPPGGSYTMRQKVLLVRGVQHVLIADICVTNTFGFANVDAGSFEFKAAGTRLGKVQYRAIRPRETFRRKVFLRFTPTASGSQDLDIIFSRAWGAQRQTPRHHIDNIELLRAPGTPLITPRGERKIGGSLTVDFYGSANRRFLVFVAGNPRPRPIAVPGFLGTWSLPFPPTALLVHSGTFNGLATARRVAFLSATSFGSLAGVRLYWQAIEDTVLGPRLGTPASFGIYN